MANKFGYVAIEFEMGGDTFNLKYNVQAMKDSMKLQNALQGKVISKASIKQVFDSTLSSKFCNTPPQNVDVLQFFPEIGFAKVRTSNDIVNLHWKVLAKETGMGDYDTLKKKCEELENRINILEMLSH